MAEVPFPTSKAPALKIKTVDGDFWELQQSDAEKMVLLVFYRGYHCNICKKYLMRLNEAAQEFRQLGINEILAVSGDDFNHANASKREWNLDNIKLGYGQSIHSMVDWGLFVSRAIQEEEPDYFGEPGLFIINGGHQIYYSAITSMPFGRPHIGDMLEAMQFIQTNHYPPRGTVAVDRLAAAS